ncbi:MAG: chemotaxis protein CheA, partial [Proteobacteria bacterium]
MGFSELGAFTHEFESFILKLKNGEIKIDHRAVDLLLAGNDHLRQYFEALKADLNAVLDSRVLVANFSSFRSDEAPSADLSALSLAGIPDAAAFSDEAYVSAEAPPLSADLNEFAAITEEHLMPPAPAALLPAPAKNPKAPASADESIRVSLSRVEKLIDFVGEAVIMQTMLKELSLSGSPALRRSVHHLGKVIKEVQDLSMGLRMLPIKGTFQKMQRIVRDTSSILNKQVHLELEGEETEIDKTVLESLGDPLVHMVRNGVDHGIEMPEARVAAGKPAAGTIRLRAFHQSGRLVIEIRDDGAGISASRLRKKAVEKGILSEAAAQNLSEQEAIHLIFHPGFSTKVEVTEVSGRGVGMDVVKTNIESLQGEVNVTTVEGQGSLFRISLPLTLAIIDGMIVRSGNQRYVVPLNHVHESMKPGAKDLHKTAGMGEMLLLRGENLPVYR